MIRRLVAAAVLLGVAGGCLAQSTIYRCGNEYSRAPCSSSARLIDTSESARSEAQRAEATRVAASERKLADDMERDRLRAEASIRPAAAGSLGPSKTPSSGLKATPAAKAKKKKKEAAESQDFVAVVPKAKG